LARRRVKIRSSQRCILRRSLSALFLVATLATSAQAACLSSGRAASVEEIVGRVLTENRKYVFIGEQHAVGPVKRFAVDLANALAAEGEDVGLYVEGFRTDCRAGDGACPSLARLFNEPAFLTLLAHSRATVHGIDPVEDDHRAARMAASIAAGGESIRVVLVGSAHVLHAGDDQAELWVYGGGVRYPDPGDLVEAFSARERLTVGLETMVVADAPYHLIEDGCAADYVLAAPNMREYWTEGERSLAEQNGRDAQPAGR
jgi:hypothetical protein